MAKRRSNGEGGLSYIKNKNLWQVRIMAGHNDNGKPHRHQEYFKTEKEARKRLKELQKEVSDGLKSFQGKISFGEWLQKWLVMKKVVVRFRTWENYEMLIRVHITPKLGDIQLEKLKLHHLQAALNAILKYDDGNSMERTAGLCRIVCSSALKYAVLNDLLVKNPATGLVLPKKSNDEIVPLMTDEIQSFMEAMKGDKHELAFYILLALGLRRNEILALRWQDIDFEKKTIYIQNAFSKTPEGYKLSRPKTDRSVRLLPMSAELKRRLLEHKAAQDLYKVEIGNLYDDQNFVMTNDLGAHLTESTLRCKMNILLEKAGLRHIRLHDLRHTFATNMLENDINPRIVQDLMGHTSLHMTMHYTHSVKSLKEKAVAQIGELLERGMLRSQETSYLAA